MKLTATDFRQALFSTLESAAKGTEVIITHKGKEYKLIAVKPRKWLDQLAGITPVPGFEVVGGEIEPNESTWDEKKWVQKWRKRGL
jgi:prevent-host-death family protein